MKKILIFLIMIISMFALTSCNEYGFVGLDIYYTYSIHRAEVLEFKTIYFNW